MAGMTGGSHCPACLSPAAQRTVMRRIGLRTKTTGVAGSQLVDGKG